MRENINSNFFVYEEKVTALFKYVSEIKKNSEKTIKNILSEKVIWYYFLENLPKSRYIEYNISSNSENLLKIKKPNFLAVFHLEKELKQWINGEWEDYKSEVFIKDERVIEKIVIENEKRKKVSEIEKIPKDIKEKLSLKIEERKYWVEEQKLIESVRKIFDELYLKYLDLNKEKETIELILGNGILNIKEKDIYYPILLRKIKIKFEATENIIYIKNFEEDQTYYSELYTNFLNEEVDLNLEEVLNLDKKVKEEDIYPLDINKIDNLFREFIHKLSVKGQYIKDIENRELLEKDAILIEDKPMIFIRKKELGISKAIDNIIKNIEENKEIPNHLIELVGISKPEENETLDEKINISENEILFVKETNKEQIEIAKRIEKNKAVVVQGPPGTGKTHTIANLLGHFLTQGKNVLVTSQTGKALKVLKDKIPKNIQGLCISLLDDNNTDMRRSVDSISEKMGSYDSETLKREVDSIKEKRLEEYNSLKEIREKMFKIKYKENQSLIYNGESFSIEEVGKYLRSNKEKLEIIPGDILEGVSCPVTNEELNFLDENKKNISKEEIEEIKLNLLDVGNLKKVKEFEEIISRKEEISKKLQKLLKDKKYYFDSSEFYIDEIKCINLEKYQNFLKNNELDFKEIENLKNWQLESMIAGAFEEGKKKIWKLFIEKIKIAYSLHNELEVKLFGKNIDCKGLSISESKKLLLELKEAIKNPGFLLKKRLKRAIEDIGEKILINNKKVETIEECDLILEYLELQSQKEILKNEWKLLINEDNLLEKDSYFLENLYSYIEKIEYSLNWYPLGKEKLIEKLDNIGIEKEIFFKKDGNIINEIREIPKNIEILKELLSIAKEALEIFKVEKEYEEYLNYVERLVKDFKEESAKINTEIKNAIVNESVIEYESCIDKLEKLFLKKKIYLKKKEILEKIKKVSFEWSNYLEKEEFSIEKIDILEIWKWKQLSQELEDMERKPYDKLQEELKEKVERVKKLTLELVEKLSWYHILCFVEKKENLSINQSLRGWKQSIEKIGKGTGKNAEFYRKQAREKIELCQKAIPIWIMPINRVIDTLNPGKNKFDVVIIDEASQLDISSLILLYMAKKVIIVGDDKQVSPLSVGKGLEKENMLREKYLKGRIINEDLYGMRSSLYSIASTTYQPLMLKEHFRCVPEIISYSNKTSYDFKIKPLREANSSNLRPAVINYRVDGIRNENGKTNEVEAKTIVSLIKACLEEDSYKNSSFGVISLLGNEQSELIQKLLIDKVGNIDIEEHDILCGDPGHFQGDERDVIFLSMVDSNNDSLLPLRKVGEGIDNSTKKRYNVASSRAKNQMWIVHSLDKEKDLKEGDLRRELLDFAENPKSFMLEESIKEKSDSVFEEEVVEYLVARNYNVVQQWEVGAYRIDMVVSYKEKRIAIECDGERWHSSEEQVRNDIERQEILERCGWEFIRIRGSKYFKNPTQTMKEVEEKLTKKGIYPDLQHKEVETLEKYEILDRIKERAKEILNEWDKPEFIYDKVEIEDIVEAEKEISEPQMVKKVIDILEVPDLKKVKEEKIREESIEKENLSKGLEISSKEKTKEEKNILQKNLELFSNNNLEEKNNNSTESLLSFLEKENLEYINNIESSEILWIIYSPSKEGKILNFLSEGKYNYSFDRRGAKSTNNRKAWRVKIKE